MTCQKYSWTPRVGKRKRWDWDQVQRLPEVDLSKFLLRRHQCTADLKAMKRSKENQFDSYFIVSNSHSPHFLLCSIRQIFYQFSSKEKNFIWTFRPFWLWHNLWHDHEVSGRCSWEWVHRQHCIYNAYG